MLVRSLLDQTAYQFSNHSPRFDQNTPQHNFDTVELSSTPDRFVEVLQHEAKQASNGSHRAAAAVTRLALDEGLKKARRNAAKGARQKGIRTGAPKPKSHNGWLITPC